MGINKTKHRAFEHLASTWKDSLSYENHVEDLFPGRLFLLLRSNKAVFYRRLFVFLLPALSRLLRSSSAVSHFTARYLRAYEKYTVQGVLSGFQLSGGRAVLGVLFELLLWREIKVRIRKQGQSSSLK